MFMTATRLEYDIPGVPEGIETQYHSSQRTAHLKVKREVNSWRQRAASQSVKLKHMALISPCDVRKASCLIQRCVGPANAFCPLTLNSNLLHFLGHISFSNKHLASYFTETRQFKERINVEAASREIKYTVYNCLWWKLSGILHILNDFGVQRKCDLAVNK